MPLINPDLRVLQIVKGLDIGNVHGGAERFAIELSRALKRSGVDVAVCAFFRVGTPAEKKWLAWLADAGIPCFSAVDWFGNNNFRSYWAGIRRLREALQEHPTQICHSHFQLGTIAALWMKASGLTRRVVRTCHVTQEWEPGWYGWIREQVFSKWIFPLYLDAEIGVSKEITARLQSYPGARLFHREVVYISNAIPGAFQATSAAADRINVPEGVKIIGTVGRLSEVKGQRYLLEAGRIIRQSGPEFQIWIVGDGELREELEELARRLGIREHVNFWGQREDVARILAHMDLFVMTSRREGLPTVVLESFAQGIPVVATNVPGIRELVRPGETGWLVPPADPPALADAILQALSDREGRQKFQQAGREMAKQFTMEAVAANYQSLYERLIAQGV